MVSKVASSRRVLVFLTQAGVQSWHSNIEVRILRRCVVATVCQRMCHVYLIQAVYLPRFVIALFRRSVCVRCLSYGFQSIPWAYTQSRL